MKKDLRKDDKAMDFINMNLFNDFLDNLENIPLKLHVHQ